MMPKVCESMITQQCILFHCMRQDLLSLTLVTDFTQIKQTLLRLTMG
jgi:hypothetical protein